MSEGSTRDGYSPAAMRQQPAYGDGQIAYAPPAKPDARQQRVTQVSLGLAIFAPVVAVYVVAVYGIARAIGALV